MKMQPLHDEHQELLPQIEQLRVAADAVEDVTTDELINQIDASVEFLADHLLPHAQAEEAVLYRKIDELSKAEVTATMREDHVAIVEYVDQLEKLRADLPATEKAGEQARDLRRVLYGLHALIAVHFAKEEAIYVPFLESHLSEEDAQRLFAEMSEVAHRTGATENGVT